MDIEPIASLPKALGMPFHALDLLEMAFTHASYVHDHKAQHATKQLIDNERLEFLGDAVLGLVISRYLYLIEPPLSEGEMTKWRAAIVCEASLADFARTLGFHRYLKLGRGEEQSGGRLRPSILADTFEAFIGALYLDQGLPGVEDFMMRHIIPRIERGERQRTVDHKSALQEWAQREEGRPVEYAIISEDGPAHARSFVAQVSVAGEVMGQGYGRSKKEAEQRAAEEALQKLGLLSGDFARD
ncbi:MAG: ribonuclease III [Candidatus Carbobacillus altaicus]|uniref:Ribonuclease 3 n=1 Tax=Candidatus Carbonibacillus altaicus TaxID=2163959 RepID=A0A2R6Y5F0_9BACL|nr:ribonuclease III [Candidatus Carbobacillus altaicus]PTQ57906.1 MAG: Ribonuclease III [Candidatus Carbobacillus altaicus]